MLAHQKRKHDKMQSQNEIKIPSYGPQAKNLQTLFIHSRRLLQKRIQTRAFEPPHDKPTKWLCAQRRHPPSLISVFVVCMKKAWVLSNPLSAQRRLWSDWVDTHTDLRLRWAHRSFCWFCPAAAHFISLIARAGKQRLLSGYSELLIRRF